MPELNIPDALVAWSDGMTAERAAVGLLLDHGTWLTRGDFLDRCVVEIPEEGIAALDWEEITRALDTGALPASDSSLAVLRVVASIGARYPVDLRDALTSLDHTTAHDVARAVLAAAGVAEADLW